MVSLLSHPARGAWIETKTKKKMNKNEKCRTPPGVRGLKQIDKMQEQARMESHPARGAWIETKQ